MSLQAISAPEPEVWAEYVRCQTSLAQLLRLHQHCTTPAALLAEAAQLLYKALDMPASTLAFHYQGQVYPTGSCQDPTAPVTTLTSGPLQLTLAAHSALGTVPREHLDLALESLVVQLALPQFVDPQHLHQLQRSYEREAYIVQATGDVVYDWDILRQQVTWSDNFVTQFWGSLPPDADLKAEWMQAIHPEDYPAMRRNLDHCLQDTGQTHWVAEYRMQTPDRGYVHISSSAYILRSHDGEAQRLVGVLRDISQRKQEEQRLKLLESVITHTRDAVLITEAEPLAEPGPRILYTNPAFTAMTGYSASEVLGKSPRLLQGPLSDQRALAELGRALRRWEPHEIETINYKKSGEPFWIQFSVTPVADDMGWYTHWIAIERDITERKNRELQQQLLSEIRALFNRDDDLSVTLQQILTCFIDTFDEVDLAEMWVLNREASALERQGLAYRDPTLRLFADLTAHQTQFRLGEGLPGLIWQSQQPLLWSQVAEQPGLVRKEAALAVGLATLYGLPLISEGQVIGVLVLASRQTSPHPQAFTALSVNLGLHIGGEIKRKQLLRELGQFFRLSPDMLAINHPDGLFLKVNPAASQILEYSEAFFLNQSFGEIVYPEDQALAHHHWALLLQGTEMVSFDVRCLTASGQIRWLHWRALNLPDEGVVYSLVKDITASKKAERLLKQATELARMGAWEVDLIQEKITWSEMTYRLYGLDPAQFKPDFDSTLVFYQEGQHREQVVRAFERTLTTGEPWELESILITASGAPRWVRTQGEAEFANGQCVRVYGSIQDIHERKLAEEQLQLKTQMLSVISDFNSNLLTETNALAALAFSLQPIAETVSTDRVDYYEYDDTQTLLTPHLQWVSDFATPLASSPLPVAQDEEVLKPLLQQQACALRVADLPPGPLKTHFQAQAVKSVLLLPVYAHDHIYGCLAIADCQQARSWETETLNFLNTIALNLAKAIALQNTALQLQQSLREQNNILESINDGFLALDVDWQVRYLNQMGEQLLLMSRDQAVGKSLWQLFPDAVDTPFYTHYHQAMQNQAPVHFEEFYATLDKWFDISAYPSPTLLTIYFRDITARKQQEESLKALNVRLQKHVQALATSNQELEQFAYVASHDLQEPLRMVTSFLSQIEKKYAPVLDDKGRQYIYFAVDGAKRMRQIILDLLSFSRVTRMEEPPEEIDLNALLHEVSVLLRKRIQETQAELYWHPLPTVYSLRSPLRQMLQNLIENALKYISPERSPQIHITVTDLQTHWQIAVQDNGLGIEPEYFEKIFLIFQRLHRKEEYSGTGIGLAVCKKIVAHLEGKIWVESQFGLGSTFYFTIKKQGIS